MYITDIQYIEIVFIHSLLKKNPDATMCNKIEKRPNTFQGIIIYK